MFVGFLQQAQNLSFTQDLVSNHKFMFVEAGWCQSSSNPTKNENKHAAIASSGDSIGYIGKNGVFHPRTDNFKINNPEVFSQIEFDWNAHSVLEFHTPWFTSLIYDDISAEGVVEFPPHLVAFGIESHEKIADVRYTEKERKNRKNRRKNKKKKKKKE